MSDGSDTQGWITIGMALIGGVIGAVGTGLTIAFRAGKREQRYAEFMEFWNTHHKKIEQMVDEYEYRRDLAHWERDCLAGIIGYMHLTDKMPKPPQLRD